MKASLRGLSPREKVTIIVVYSALAIMTVSGFAASALIGQTYVVLAGLGLVAYVFGLRHGFDADHIAAIDNRVRKLMQDEKSPLTVGTWFSLGRRVHGVSPHICGPGILLEHRHGLRLIHPSLRCVKSDMRLCLRGSRAQCVDSSEFLESFKMQSRSWTELYRVLSTNVSLGDFIFRHLGCDALLQTIFPVEDLN